MTQAYQNQHGQFVWLTDELGKGGDAGLQYEIGPKDKSGSAGLSVSVG